VPRSTIPIAALAAVFATLSAGPAQAAPELSTTNRLDDRRSVVTGPRAYAVGTQDGRFPALGFHTRGEMGGVWSPPIKLLDGVWFGIGDQWLGRATRFTSGWGYTRMDFPAVDGLEVRRTDVVPGDRRGMLIGLTLRSTGAAQQVALKVHARSELMSTYPWGETKPYDQREFNLRDTATLAAGGLAFSDAGTSAPEAGPHDWAAVVASSAAPVSGRVDPDGGFRGPQDPAVMCGPSGPEAPKAPARCDDTAYGRGAGGELRYVVDVPAGGATTFWLGVGGSEAGVAGAQAELAAVLADPEGALRARVAEREALARHTRLSLPGDPLLARGIEWSKQDLAASVQTAEDLQLRAVRAGTRYGAPAGTLAGATWLGAGFPDYPWIFATDAEYTAFASVALGQFEPIAAHLRALVDVSRIVNGTSGKIVHEVTPDGAVFFGANADAGNTDETAKLPSALALLWRWTGDADLRDDLYPAARAGLRYIFRELDRDGDLWPEGLGNVERPGMGEEKLDNAVYTIRGLRDLADLARSKGDGATARWATRRARRMQARFARAWWMPGVPQHADSLAGPRNAKRQQRHWIGATPMEVEWVDARGRARFGLASRAQALAALNLRRTRCFGDAFGMFHTGRAGCDGAGEAPDELQAFTLNTAIAAVAEGNYGRLGAQRKWTRANRRLQLPRFDEQPGSMPEIAPSPLAGRTLDRPLNERPMVLQAWGAYGTAWPVVHQQLGVRPDLGRRRLEVVPQLAGRQPIAADDIRLGETGALDVRAGRIGRRYRTLVSAPAGLRVRLGHTLPRRARVARVRLDGRRVAFRARRTQRGLEVTVATGGGRHTLQVVAAAR